MDWSFLRSRGFWVAVAAAAPAVCQLLDLSDKTTGAILTILGAVAAYFTVTAIRAYQGVPGLRDRS